MPETIDQTPAPGSGGLDDAGGFGTDGGDEGGLGDGLMTPQGEIEGLDDMRPEGFGEPESDEGDGDWTAELPDDVRDVVSKYGSPAEMARALAEAQRLTGRQGDEMGKLRDQIADLASRVEAGQVRPDAGAQQGDEAPIPSLVDVAAYASNDVARKIDAGDLEPGEGLAHIVEVMAGVMNRQMEARDKEWERRLSAALDERTAPLEGHVYSTQVSRELRTIQGELGDERYNELREAAAETLRNWERTRPGFVNDPRSVRAAFQDAAYQADVRRRREASAQVLDRTGGSGRQRGKSPADMILEEMDAISGPATSGGLL